MNLVKLGDICNFFNGGAWTQTEFTEVGYPVLKVSNCKNSGFEVDDVSYIPYDIAQRSENNKLYIGDVIIATVGSHPNLVESAAGRSCIVTEKVQGFYLNQNAVCLRSKDPNVLDQRYLGYLAASAPFKHYIQSRGKGAANQMRIAIGAIKGYEFALPEIDVQRKVGSILGAYDSLIENNQKRIKLLEEAAQRLYKEWFVDLRFPGHETTPITDGIPEGWSCEAIDDVYSIKYGKTLPTTKINSAGKYPVYGASKVIGYYNQKNCDDYAILITSRGNAGVVHRTHHKKSFVTNNSFIVIPKNKDLHNAFIYFQMYQLNFKSIVTGACQQQLTNNLISQKRIVVPSTSTVKMFNMEADPLFEHIEVLIKENSNLAEARDRLLPKLMNGEIEV